MVLHRAQWRRWLRSEVRKALLATQEVWLTSQLLRHSVWAMAAAAAVALFVVLGVGSLLSAWLWSLAAAVTPDARLVRGLQHTDFDPSSNTSTCPVTLTDTTVWFSVNGVVGTFGCLIFAVIVFMLLLLTCKCDARQLVVKRVKNVFLKALFEQVLLNSLENDLFAIFTSYFAVFVFELGVFPPGPPLPFPSLAYLYSRVNSYALLYVLYAVTTSVYHAINLLILPSSRTWKLSGACFFLFGMGVYRVHSVLVAILPCNQPVSVSEMIVRLYVPFFPALVLVGLASVVPSVVAALYSHKRFPLMSNGGALTVQGTLMRVCVQLLGHIVSAWLGLLVGHKVLLGLLPRVSGRAPVGWLLRGLVTCLLLWSAGLVCMLYYRTLTWLRLRSRVVEVDWLNIKGFRISATAESPLFAHVREMYKRGQKLVAVPDQVSLMAGLRLVSRSFLLSMGGVKFYQEVAHKPTNLKFKFKVAIRNPRHAQFELSPMQLRVRPLLQSTLPLLGSRVLSDGPVVCSLSIEKPIVVVGDSDSDMETVEVEASVSMLGEQVRVLVSNPELLKSMAGFRVDWHIKVEGYLPDRVIPLVYVDFAVPRSQNKFNIRLTQAQVLGLLEGTQLNDLHNFLNDTIERNGELQRRGSPDALTPAVVAQLARLNELVRNDLEGLTLGDSDALGRAQGSLEVILGCFAEIVDSEADSEPSKYLLYVLGRCASSLLSYVVSV